MFTGPVQHRQAQTLLGRSRKSLSLASGIQGGGCSLVSFNPLFLPPGPSWHLVLGTGGILIEEQGMGEGEGFLRRVGRAMALVLTFWPLGGGPSA